MVVVMSVCANEDTIVALLVFFLSLAFFLYNFTVAIDLIMHHIIEILHPSGGYNQNGH